MPTLPRQALLSRQLPGVLDIFARNGLPITSAMETLVSQVEHFQIDLHLIGAKSSGKTSLLNTYLDQQPAPMTHLVLHDQPGFETCEEACAYINAGCTQRSRAYMVVISVEDISLPKPLCCALQALAEHKDTPVFFIFTKIDKLQSSLARIKALMHEVRELMNPETMHFATASAHKKMLFGFQEAIQEFSSQAEQIFECAVTALFLRELQNAHQQLTDKGNPNPQDTLHLQAQIDALDQPVPA